MLPEPFGIDCLLQVEQGECLLFPSLDNPPPSYIHSVGFREEAETNEDACPERWRHADVTTIQYQLRGRGQLRYQGRDLAVERGQLILLDTPSDGRYTMAAGERGMFFYVTFAGPHARQALRDVADRLGPVFTLDETSPALARLADVCAAALAGKILSPHHSCEIARGVVRGLVSESATMARIQATARADEPAFVTEVEQFCKPNLGQPIGVGDMAKVAKMSRFHFSRQFKRVRGISPGRYLADLRLDEAVKLVANGRLAVKEVAKQCGFGDANYFCKVFRKSFGISPGAYRANGARAAAPNLPG